MIDVNARVDGQRLSLPSAAPGTCRGTRNLLRINFDFSGGWDGMSVAAVFGDEAVPVEEGSCMVPNELADDYVIPLRLVGKRGDQVLTTNTIKIRQV